MGIVLTDAVLDGAVVGVDDGRSAVGDPIGFVHGQPQSVEGELGAEEGHVQDALQVEVGVDFQLSAIFN